MTSPRVRRLIPDDAGDVLSLLRMSEATLTRELSSAADYCWMGLVEPAEGLVAVHRSLRWGDHLLLKGVLVKESARGGSAALELAFALRDLARDSGYAGVVAWVEPRAPEAGLARLLRLRETGCLLHRYEVETGAPAEPSAASGSSGTVVVGRRGHGDAPAMVPDLVGTDGAARPATVRWTVDRHRLVLSGFPYPAVPDSSSLLRDLSAPIRRAGVTAVEFPLPASDLAAALTVTRAGARRLSRTAVRLGRLDFRPAPAARRRPAGTETVA